MAGHPASRFLARRLAGGLSALAASVMLGGMAAAQQQGGGLGSGEPIEIVSDRLVVEQEKQLATFSGNVNAVQGDLSLRADQLRVLYARSDDRAAGGDQQSIRRIEADGNVLLTSPGQIAQGRTGVYEVPQGQVTLQGDVVLTRGSNVVRGDRLEANLNTGVSTVTAARNGTAGGQRVRALFAPAAKQPAEGKARSGNAPAPAANGPKPAPAANGPKKER